MGFKMSKVSRSAGVPEQPGTGGGLATAAVKPSPTARDAGTVRISFRMGRDLHTRLKLESVRQGRTIVGMLEGFVAEHTPAA